MSRTSGEAEVVSLKQSRESRFQNVTEPVWLLYVATGESRYLVQITPPVPRIPPVQVFLSAKSNPGKYVSWSCPDAKYERVIVQSMWSFAGVNRQTSLTGKSAGP